MAASPYERQVAMQLAIAQGILIIREFSAGTYPKPRQVLGAGIVFAGLSVVQVAGPSWQRVASLMGWLIVLGIGMTALAKQNDILARVAGVGSGSAPLFPQGSATTTGNVTA